MNEETTTANEVGNKIYLASNLKALRKFRELSQEDVYNRTGIKRSTLSAYELGTVEPSMSTLLHLCKFYHVTPTQILTKDLAE
jgi:transcriptional regulator with XRE-family HTH domain